MINFIKRYFQELRNSDEATIHSHSVTMSVVLSVIILSFVFAIWGKDIFNFDSFKNTESLNQIANTENLDTENSTTTNVANPNLEPPMKIIGNFFSESASEFGKLKENFLEFKSAVNLKENSTSTSPENN